MGCMARCSQPLLSRRVRRRFRCTSGPRHRRSAMRSMDRLQVRASSGWKAIGNQLVTITGGSGGAGNVLHLKGHTGVIRVTTTIAKAGKSTRDIGTVRITTTATGETMVTIATIMITTTTDHRCTFLHPQPPFLVTVRNVEGMRGANRVRRRTLPEGEFAGRLAQSRPLWVMEP